jgi:hypothetical protein
MTEPADLAAMIEGLPGDVPALARVVQGLVIHGDWLDRYGANRSAFGTISRTTLPIRQRLAALIERDSRDLDECRVPAQRSVGTCRDFALMLCAFLRAKGTPARVVDLRPTLAMAGKITGFVNTGMTVRPAGV